MPSRAWSRFCNVSMRRRLPGSHEKSRGLADPLWERAGALAPGIGVAARLGLKIAPNTRIVLNLLNFTTRKTELLRMSFRRVGWRVARLRLGENPLITC